MSKVPEPREGEPIRLVFTKRGEPRYRVRVDTNPHPLTGRRRQVWSTHRTLSDARAHVVSHKNARARGTLVTPERQTFQQYADGWLATRALRVRVNTANGYRDALKRAYAEFGATPLQRVSRADVERLVGSLVAAGLTKRTASLTLFVLRSVFEQAVHDGVLGRNPASRVEPAGAASKTREALSAQDLARLRAHLLGDPQFACWLLSLSGLRRSEVLGLRWSDVDLTAGTLSIQRGRTPINARQTVEGAPKTRRGARTLPLTADLSAALRALRRDQLATFGTEQVRTGFLAVNAVGEPVRPEAWSDAWRDHCRAAGVPDVTLHAARHSSVTAMRNAGVPDHVVAAWHGHDEYVMRSVYSHADPTGLAAAGEALTAALGGVR